MQLEIVASDAESLMQLEIGYTKTLSEQVIGV